MSRHAHTPHDDDILGKAYDPRITRRLLGYLKPHGVQIILALVLMVVHSAAALAGPYIIRLAIDEGMTKGQITLLARLVLLFVLAKAVEWAGIRGRLFLMAYVGTKIIYTVRTQLFQHLQRLTLSFYSRYAVGRLMSRLMSDVNVLQDFVTWSVVGVFRDMFLLAGIIVAMLAMNVKLSLLTFIVLPVMVVLTSVWRVRVRESYRQVRRRIASVNAYLNESITGVRVAQAFSREGRNLIHFDGLNRDHLEANLDAARLAALFFPSVDVLGSVAVALAVGYGGLQVLSSELTAGIVVAFILYIERFFDPIRDLAQRYNTLQAAMASGERIFELLDTEPELKDPEDAVELPPLRGEIRLEGVSFSYEDDIPVLEDITLCVKPGQMVAFVGETGAGKSSLVRLLGRFYDIDGGRITVDGYDVRGVTRESLRRQMGVVLQEPFLFAASIRENLRYGRLDAADEAIMAAARAVGAHDFITRLPDGYDTNVGEGGINLSVGQRQLISFARALLADPRILILDEATSSVDTQTELLIQQALERLLRDRTSFVIAHRLSTIVRADLIVVLHKGRIVERGTHENLLALRGHYYRLYTMQFRAQAQREVMAA